MGIKRLRQQRQYLQRCDEEFYPLISTSDQTDYLKYPYKIAYPKNTNVKAKIKDGELIVNFENQKQAVFLELSLR